MKLAVVRVTAVPIGSRLRVLLQLLLRNVEAPYLSGRLRRSLTNAVES
jgi:hypothetical protein